MLQYAVPPGYQRQQPIKRPKLGPWVGVIDAILSDDKQRPTKQRHTSKRIFERLRDEHGYTGGITVVKEYVHERRLRSREMFVPLRHDPGHAQVDFGEALAVIGGEERKIHFFALDLPHSDACLVQAYPWESSEAFCEGHRVALELFGGVPRSILYDNTKLAVARILGDGRRLRTRVFSELQSHYLFADRFGRPGKGNDKGKVEGLVGYARRNFMVPIPYAASFAELNARLLEHCRRRLSDRLRGHDETIGERLERDRAAFLPLPATPYEACEKRAARVSSLSLVRYRRNDYSVPTAYGHREVLVRGYVHEVVIACGADEIARHPRSYEREDFIFDPLHYLALLEHKIGALDQAAPLVGWALPEEFGTLRRLLEARLGKPGKREFVQVLRLLEVFRTDDVSAAVRAAIGRGVISFDAVKHLVLCRIERRPPRLDLKIYPYLPQATVATTSARSYMSLLAGGAAS
jgi:transposase